LIAGVQQFHDYGGRIQHLLEVVQQEEHKPPLVVSTSEKLLEYVHRRLFSCLTKPERLCDSWSH
jgi:hypothetical protein